MTTNKLANKKSKEVAIRVEAVSKTFKVPQEKRTSLRGAALNIFTKKSYDNFEALKDISFEIKKGEFFGIIGRNGSGKSTLLKMLAGIYVTDSGKITIEGKLSPFLELGVGFNPELTGRENLYLGGAILGLSKKEIDGKYEKIVAFSELDDFMDMKLKNYSSGMQVRLAFTLAINAHAEILLMDEVLAVGDSNFQAKCIEEFNNYKEQGKTVVLVSHDIGTIKKYCDRAMLLRNGKIVKIGKAEEVGNEYMQQNMSDEELRVAAEELRVATEEESNIVEAITESQDTITKKRVKITKIEFLDRNEKEKNVFKPGEQLTVRVYFKRYISEADLNFGIALYNKDGSYVLGINTIMDKIDNDIYYRLGYFQVDYKNINLLANSYYVATAITKNNFSMPYDLISKSKSFRIISETKNEGIVNMEYEWKK
ncbi:MAG: ABC transporter ATP-binding protein [bacterium]